MKKIAVIYGEDLAKFSLLANSTSIDFVISDADFFSLSYEENKHR